MKSEELIKKLKKAGWVHVRTRGSHHLFEKEGEQDR
ncbi:type II toxin-antitoxin system HicA family toxin [Candidatus Symbiopectobacterium sp. NZEC127]